MNHDIDRMVQYAVRVWNVDQDFANPQCTALEGINRLKAFYKSLGLPTSLTEIGITEEAFDYTWQTTAAETNGDGVGFFVKLSTQDIKNILKIAQ